MSFLYCIKKGMIQAFGQDGRLVPITVLKMLPGKVVDVFEFQGQSRARLGIGSKKRASKPQVGQGRGYGKFRLFKESAVQEKQSVEPGQDYYDLFKTDDIKKVHVSSVSKGKGFAGTVKRHGFNRGPTTHGHDHHRQPGSIGASADPSRVFKGKRMPGRLGGKLCTVKNLEVFSIDWEKEVLLVKGGVPGSKNTLVQVRAV